jgi:hypothetical protein
MIKNILHTIARNSQKKTSSLVQKKAIINEIVNAEHRAQTFNPKRARYKSMKGINVRSTK